MIRRAATPELIANRLADPVFEYALPSRDDRPVREIRVVRPIVALQKRHATLDTVSDRDHDAIGRPARDMKVLPFILPTGVDLDQGIDGPCVARMTSSNLEDPTLTTRGFLSAEMPHVVNQRNECFLEIRDPFARIVGRHAADVPALKEVGFRIDWIRHVLPIGPDPFTIDVFL